MKIISVVGARPNFMKIAPIHKAFKNLNRKDIQHIICHTGQHYDELMSKVFFDDLELPEPDIYLGVGSGTHSEQTARIMIEFEKVLLKEKPDLIIVVGDVNSTIACSLTAAKLNIKVAHVEAGLRSFDRTMPEEINRMLTDRISDYLFVTEKSGIENLEKEGVDKSKIFFTGNVMIDSLINYLPKSENSDILGKLNLILGEYILVTLHRPSNVDSEKFLKELFLFFKSVSEKKKIVFPVHPRTRKNIEQLDSGLSEKISSERILLMEPVGYLDFLNLMKNSFMLITDSGGIQEETTYLKIPCITIRENTERPVTIYIGTNFLAGTDFGKIKEITFNILDGNGKEGTVPELWDGQAAERIVNIITNSLEAK